MSNHLIDEKSQKESGWTRSVKVCAVVIGILLAGTIAMGWGFSSLIEANRDLSNEIRDLRSKLAEDQSKLRDQLKLHEAQSKKETYELQERCSKTAEEYFTRNHSRFEETDTGYVMTKHNNHYNLVLNKCFIEIGMTIENYKNPQNKYTLLISNVIDVNENVSYASFSNIKGAEVKPEDCEVQGKTCKSKDEWNSLVETFLED